MPRVQPREEHFFGLWMQDQRSLVLAKDNLLISYGSAEARERPGVRSCWVELGMPTAASLGSYSIRCDGHVRTERMAGQTTRVAVCVELSAAPHSAAHQTS